MKTRFRTIRPTAIRDNPFHLIDSDWMLVTAGTMKKWNTMTASWGGLGVLWNKPVAFSFIRPTRYTFEFMERASRYTLSFFAERFRKSLEFCGSNSGREVDKAKATGLESVAGRTGCVYFRQARLVLECRKLYYQDIDPKRFLDSRTIKFYPQRDFHRLYIGEITRVLTTEK